MITKQIQRKLNLSTLVQTKHWNKLLELTTFKNMIKLILKKEKNEAIKWQSHRWLFLVL